MRPSVRLLLCQVISLSVRRNQRRFPLSPWLPSGQGGLSTRKDYIGRPLTPRPLSFTDKIAWGPAMVPSYTMDPNAGYPAGYPVPTQTPPNQMSFYPNSIPQYPQSKTPLQPVQQQQHSFGAMPMQPGGIGGAMMPPGFPPQTSGTWSISFVVIPFIMICPTYPSLFPCGVDLSLSSQQPGSALRFNIRPNYLSVRSSPPSDDASPIISFLLGGGTLQL